MEAERRTAEVGAAAAAAEGEEEAAEVAWWREEAEAEGGGAAAQAAVEGEAGIDELVERLLASDAEDAVDEGEGGDEADAEEEQEEDGGREPRVRTTLLRAAWSGARWWPEAWTGAVAAAEYRKARAGTRRTEAPASVATKKARASAQQRSMDAAATQGWAAGREAVREASKRCRKLWQAEETEEARCGRTRRR